MPISRSTSFLIIISGILGIHMFIIAGQLLQGSPLPQISLAASTSGIRIGLATPPPTEDKEFRAVSAVLWDSAEHKLLWQQNPFERRPLASITKLMTAMVALDYGISWNMEADILPQEYGIGGQLQLFSGEKVTMEDLVNASLVGSANNATLAYVRQLGIPQDEFILAMNRKAVSLGLEQTEFHDVTGLSVNNLSNAYDMAKMADDAFNQYPDISRITSQKEYSFTVLGAGREHTIRNTNKLISDHNIPATGSKTGYLYETQYCLIMQGAANNAHRIAIVLGSPSEEENFADVARLIKMAVAP